MFKNFDCRKVEWITLDNSYLNKIIMLSKKKKDINFSLFLIVHFINKVNNRCKKQ